MYLSAEDMGLRASPEDSDTSPEPAEQQVAELKLEYRTVVAGASIYRASLPGEAAAKPAMP